ncbi:hypothetical protein LOM8899_00197 [Flavimaricola marinus]|uniref:Uncharacterized protein n=1 Tax=Flavimaricola marinus TaxID=1819565 RepID=A0A238LAS6_9RHOB|nr:hypothetical protein LOM8899_00197 [Flavimaricola marinus]
MVALGLLTAMPIEPWRAAAAAYPARDLDWSEAAFDSWLKQRFPDLTSELAYKV